MKLQSEKIVRLLSKVRKEGTQGNARGLLAVIMYRQETSCYVRTLLYGCTTLMMTMSSYQGGVLEAVSKYNDEERRRTDTLSHRCGILRTEQGEGQDGKRKRTHSINIRRKLVSTLCLHITDGH